MPRARSNERRSFEPLAEVGSFQTKEERAALTTMRQERVLLAMLLARRQREAVRWRDAVL